MLFVVCTVFGVMLLVCQITLSVLGIGESLDFWDEDINPNSESDQVTTCENELAEASPAADQGELCVETPKAGIASLRAIGTAITFFGLMGSAAESSRFATLPTIAIASAAGSLAFLGVSVLFRLAAFQPYRTETKNRLDDSQKELCPRIRSGRGRRLRWQFGSLKRYLSMQGNTYARRVLHPCFI